MGKYSIKLIILFFILLIPTEALALSPIAHTDVVPYQRVEYGATFHLGVVAFSKPGIANVSFAIASGTATYNGSSPVTSSSMALNSRVASTKFPLGVWEYYITISASDFTGNGTFTVTPTVTDNDSNTRVLSAVTMIVEGSSAYTHNECWVDPVGSDGTGTANDEEDPFPSISTAVAACQTANSGDSSGNIIYLEEYDGYSLTGLSWSSSGEWLTITKSASAAKGSVIITTGQPTSSGGLKLDNVTLESQTAGTYILQTTGTTNRTRWTNSCRMIGSGQYTANSSPINFNLVNPSAVGHYYSTDDYFTTTYDTGLGYSDLNRGSWIETIGGDAFKNFSCVINGYVDGMTNGAVDEYHFDAMQIWHVSANEVDIENRLAYNVFVIDAHYQGIMRSNTLSGGNASQDNAFVNVFIEMREDGEDGGNGYRQISSALSGSINGDDHLLVWHCSFPYSHTSWGNTPTNSSFVGNLFWQEISDDSQAGTTEWLYNHFQHVYGTTGACTGTSRYIDSGWACPKADSGTAAVLYDTGSSTASYGDGVVDITDDTASDFGYPVAESALIDALSSTYVPADLWGRERDSNPDIGALEYSFGYSESNGVSAAKYEPNAPSAKYEANGCGVVAE